MSRIVCLILTLTLALAGATLVAPTVERPYDTNLEPLSPESPANEVIPPEVADVQVVPVPDDEPIRDNEIASSLIRPEVKYACKSAEIDGITLDASLLGGEYAFTLHENGTADVSVAGIELSNLLCVPVEGGLNVDYYGNSLPIVYTEEGFDMNYFDTMTLHFILAE